MSWLVLAALSAVLSALLVILSTYALNGVDSVLTNAIRVVIVSMVLVPWCFMNGSIKGLAQAWGTTEMNFAIASGIVAALAWTAYYEAIARGQAEGTGTATAVTAINYSSLLIMALLQPFFQKGIRFDRVQIAGAVLVVIGVALILRKPATS